MPASHRQGRGRRNGCSSCRLTAPLAPHRRPSTETPRTSPPTDPHLQRICRQAVHCRLPEESGHLVIFELARPGLPEKLPEQKHIAAGNRVLGALLAGRGAQEGLANGCSRPRQRLCWLR